MMSSINGTTVTAAPAQRFYNQTVSTSLLSAFVCDSFAAFEATLSRIALKNSVSIDAKFALNAFSDQWPAEFGRHRRNFKLPSLAQMQFPVADLSGIVIDNNVTAFDWRSKNAITWVKDQGQCGSCWAFSAVEAIESQWFLTNGTLVPLAPQQVVDCDLSLIDSGCHGGTTQFTYEYIKAAGGLMTENDYPYESGESGERGFCMFRKKQAAAHISGWSYTTPVCADFACDKQDESKLITALLGIGPVSVCLDGDPFQEYSSGVLTADQCRHGLLNVDHCVQAVGFNTTGTIPYWIVRNSWGQQWGQKGYIYLEMGKNTCGIANIATQPQIPK